MREEQIRIKPFDALAVLSYEAVHEPNQHGMAVITAQISSDKEQEYLSMAGQTQATWVEIMVRNETGEEQVLFCGVLCCMKIKKQADNSVMELKLATGTILLEDKYHTRSFQAETLTYRDVVDTCNESYEDAATIMTTGKGETLPHFILQYRENDWEFLKRMCTLAGGMLMPSCTVKGVKYFFGMPDKRGEADFQTDHYTIINDKIMSYAIESRELYTVGEKAGFMGQSYLIWKVTSKMQGSELYHTYYISTNTKPMIQEHDKYRERMTGASLFGRVTAVDGESVKITISEDENKENAGERWFPYSTVYSSSDGAGWYCMPEIGDKIRLYIPAPDESDAYVCSAVHEQGGNGIRTNPEHKIWRNQYEKEIRLTPDKILITNNKGTSIELSDDSGIHIKSSGSVNIKAGGRMQISSESSGIELTASNRIRIQQGESEMLLQDGIQFTGAKVNIK